MNPEITDLTLALGRVMIAKGWKLTVAESCTGGGLAYAITSIGGSSAWFEQGFVTYSNTAKKQQLGISHTVLNKFGAVSGQVVLAMARGALGVVNADIAVAISGIAGPGGGTIEKPVGTVWVAWATKDTQYNRLFEFSGDRQSIREQAIAAALEGSLSLANFQQQEPSHLS